MLGGIYEVCLEFPSRSMMCVPSFIKFGSGVQQWLGGMPSTHVILMVCSSMPSVSELVSVLTRSGTQSLSHLSIHCSTAILCSYVLFRVKNGGAIPREPSAVLWLYHDAVRPENAEQADPTMCGVSPSDIERADRTRLLPTKARRPLVIPKNHSTSILPVLPSVSAFITTTQRQHEGPCLH
jgi:hypothetical protein